MYVSNLSEPILQKIGDVSRAELLSSIDLKIEFIMISIQKEKKLIFSFL